MPASQCHRLTALALLAATFAAAPVLAQHDDARRIEQGLRPAVALAGKPVPTRSLREEMERLQVPGVSVAVIRGGKPFPALLQETVLLPLGMKDSSFAQPLPASLMARARFALGVQRIAAEQGAGLLSPGLARDFLTPVRNGYALGLEIEGRSDSTSFGHGGSNMGYQNTLLAYVNQGDGVVVTNGDKGAELAQSFLRAVAHEYRWPSNQTIVRRVVALSPKRQEALVGIYEIKGLGTFEILEQHRQLMIALREGMMEPLYAASPDKLFLLSREMELRMASDGSPAGRLLSGSFDVLFKRVPPAKKKYTCASHDPSGTGALEGCDIRAHHQGLPL